MVEFLETKETASPSGPLAEQPAKEIERLPRRVPRVYIEVSGPLNLCGDAAAELNPILPTV